MKTINNFKFNIITLEVYTNSILYYFTSDFLVCFPESGCLYFYTVAKYNTMAMHNILSIPYMVLTVVMLVVSMSTVLHTLPICGVPLPSALWHGSHA